MAASSRWALSTPANLDPTILAKAVPCALSHSLGGVSSVSTKGEQNTPRVTRWTIEREGANDGIYESAKGRFFKPGDYLILPPPARGSRWKVVSVSEAEGYDGHLVLEAASPGTA
jgi:hypothetical protein